MKATTFEFRFRIGIAVLLYLLGFWAPWTRYGNVPPATTAWLALSTTLANWHWLPLDKATLLVTILAIVLTFLAAALRTWGTAWLGSSIVHSSSMHAGAVMAGGPYRFVRNPLYIGAVFFALGVSILMPPSGAAVFIPLIAIFYFRLILGEEAYLAQQLGAPYLEYRQRVPRLVPSLRPRVPAPPAHARWLEGAIAECMMIGYAVCFATLAWRYQPELLVRCLLVCFGISLVARALLPQQRPAS